MDAILLIVVLQLAILILGMVAWREQAGWLRILLMLTGTGVVVGALAILDRSWVAGVVPMADLMVWGNPAPLGAALLAAAAWHHPRARRAFSRGLMLLLVLLADGVAWRFLVEPPLPTRAIQTEDGSILQSTDSTCTAATAANLLALSGITTDETRMAELCRTGAKGTTNWGLYRGLRTMVDADPRQLRVRLATETVDDLLTRGGPAIISVKLTPEIDAREPRYREQWGWLLDQPHSVIFLRRDGEIVEMLDPRVGHERWSLAGLRDLWNGRVAWIEPLPQRSSVPLP